MRQSHHWNGRSNIQYTSSLNWSTNHRIRPIWTHHQTLSSALCQIPIWICLQFNYRNLSTETFGIRHLHQPIHYHQLPKSLLWQSLSNVSQNLLLLPNTTNVLWKSSTISTPTKEEETKKKRNTWKKNNKLGSWPSMPRLYLFSKAKAQSDDYEEPYTTTHWLTLGYYKLKYIESGAFLNKNSPFVKRVQFELHHKQFSIHHF